MRAQDWSAALGLLARAPDADLPIEALMDKALALRMTGRAPEALEALQAVLVKDPRNFLALLSKGSLLERLGRKHAAATVYGQAIAVAPPAEHLPPGLQQPLANARAHVARQSEALAAHLEASLRDLRARFAGESLDRFDEALNIFAGRARPYMQQPLLLHYPRLPAIPFYDRSQFPWLERLEAATPAIEEELAAVLSLRADDFAPYIAFPPGAPVDQWAELNHSPLWSTFYLWRDGVRQDRACELCPKTAALLESLPMARQTGFAPTAVFSRLAPHTRIPPHTGSTNARLLVHLPLVLPGPARFRVGAETRPWRMGEAWVFDDTIEHEAWNDADEARTILIFDIWNPLLSEAERELISAMMAAKNRFAAGE